MSTPRAPKRRHLFPTERDATAPRAERGRTRPAALAVAFLAGALLGRATPPAAASTDPVYRAADVLVAVYDLVLREHVDPPKGTRLMAGAIAGMAAAVDPYTEHLDATRLARFHQATDGRYAGIGAEISVRDGRPIVVAPLSGGPAARAGVASGDRILAVDGRSTAGQGLSELIELLVGPAGSSVALELGRDERIWRLELTREVIEIEPVVGYWLTGDVAVLHLRTFTRGAAERLRARWASLQAEREVPAAGLILDLRGNAGGLVTEAASAAGAFLPSGEVVSTRGRHPRANARWGTRGAVVVPAELPLAVVVDAGTASAAEILAAALRDHGRAPLIGQQTFGKGSVQVLRTLPDGSGLKLTHARYYTPSGAMIDGRGLTPDVAVAKVTTRRGEVDADATLREALRVVAPKDVGVPSPSAPIGAENTR